LVLIPPPPSSTLFPYTTLFRSHVGGARREAQRPGGRHGRVAGGGLVGDDAHLPGEAARLADRLLRPMAGIQVIDGGVGAREVQRSEEHTSELQSRRDLVCRLLL